MLSERQSQSDRCKWRVRKERSFLERSSSNYGANNAARDFVIVRPKIRDERWRDKPPSHASKRPSIRHLSVPLLEAAIIPFYQVSRTTSFFGNKTYPFLASPDERPGIVWSRRLRAQASRAGGWVFIWNCLRAPQLKGNHRRETEKRRRKG